MNVLEFIVEIQDFPGYFVSTRGRIFSEKYGDMRELKHCSNIRTGYLMVSLQKEGKGHSKHIHRLVAETFLERVEGKNEVDHINRLKYDNRVENLHWVDRRENNINKGMFKHNTTGITGVYFYTTKNRWVGLIFIEANKKKTKYFKTKEEAITWREEMEKKYYN